MSGTEDENQYEQVGKYRVIAPGSSFMCMFSGGKDSGLAFSLARQYAEPIALIHIIDGEKSLYHEQQENVIRAQADCMGVPLTCIPYKWWHNWDAIQRDLTDMHETGADSIAFGDIRLKYIFMGDIPLCQRTGYRAYLPLAGLPYSKLMDMLEQHRIVTLITRINHPDIRPELLGKPFTREVFQEFSSLDIDPFGELDEFHTTLVDADCFRKPLRYHLVYHSNHFAEVVVEDAL